MSLNPNYIIAPSPEQYYVDKTTGLPLANGKVYFYSDVNRSVLKPIYTISGSPPSYSYVQLPNPSTLSGVGTFQDAGNNNVIPYYYPFDADGNVELYYIEVFDENDVLQFTREAWPNFTGTGGNVETANSINYIPNGQFLAHNNLPADILNDIPFGQVTQDVTEVAPGGWTYERSSGSTATDNIQFFRYGEYVTNPSASPRYAIQIVCSSPDVSDVFKELRIKYNDVNKFSSDTDLYTFILGAETVTSGNFQVTLDLIKYFGTGGSPSATQITTLTTFNITATQTAFQFSFAFGSNEGFTIGTNNDDYVALALSFPTNTTFGILATDFGQFFGEIDVEEYPATTNRDFMARTLVLPPPDPNGFDLYLPAILTKDGLSYDMSQIGTIESNVINQPTPISSTTNILTCNGDGYLTQEYSPLGIPYARLQSVLWVPAVNQSRFGPGPNFVATSILTSATNALFMAANSTGTAVAPVDGGVPTGFTFFPVTGATVVNTNLGGNIASSNLVTCIAQSAGNVTAPDDGTSGFTITTYRDPTSVSALLMFNISTIAATTLASKYFTFTTLPGPTDWYMWFTVDGSGTDPAPGGTGIEVDLKSTYTAADVATIIAYAIEETQVNVISTVAASGMTAGSYFTFGATGSNNFFVWYKKDGAGTAPSIPGSLGIEVDIVTADTAAQVATKTTIAINMFSFATPNLTDGKFLRGFGGGYDLDADTRYGKAPGLYGNQLGTAELDQLMAHSHPYNIRTTGVGDFGAGGTPYSTASNSASNTSQTGGTENRPVNMYVNFVIRY